MSKQVDQFRREFVYWTENRIKQLEKERQAAMRENNWLRVGGLAMQMDELENVKFSVLPMTR